MDISKLMDLLAERNARFAILFAILLGLGVVVLGAGWRLCGAGLLLLALLVGAAFYLLVVKPARLPEGSVLVLRLAGRVREEFRRSPMEQIVGRVPPTLYELRRALEAAASDRRLAGVVVEIAGLEVGFALAQELHELLADVRQAQKRVVAVLACDNVTARDYLVACGAGEIVANPDAMLLMLGVATGSLFLKNALEKLHIQAQTLQWKEYKGVGEMFSREQMSPELRESLEAIVADWQTLLVDTVAGARKLSPERARELLGTGFVGAGEALRNGLVDRVGYVEDVRAEFDPAGKGRKFVGLGRYLRRLSILRRRRAKARLALIQGTGPVIAGEAPAAGEFISGEATAAQFNRASLDDDVRAIVFRVNSPGGSAVGSDLVWRAVREAQKRGKPVVVSMGDVAGSGGYYVAMGADAIVAGPATITGSIGVIYAKFNLGALLGELGVGVDFAKSAASADALSLTRAMTEAELAQLNGVVGELYSNFIAKVAEGRKLGLNEAEKVARGRVWSGMAARSQGLVDELGGLKRAIALAREKAGLRPHEPHELVPYPAPGIMAGLRAVLRPSVVPWRASALAALLGVPEHWLPAVLRLFAAGRAMFFCPFF